MEEEVSSSPAACSEAPSARDWLAEETCDEAEATCSAPSVRPSMTRLNGPGNRSGHQIGDEQTAQGNRCYDAEDDVKHL